MTNHRLTPIIVQSEDVVSHADEEVVAEEGP